MDPEAVEAADDPVELLRRQGESFTNYFPIVPTEVTNWLDEHRAITETCTLADLSHHMASLRLTGPDVLDLLGDLCVNDFDQYEVGRAKQIVMCTPRGHYLGDGPLLRIAEDECYGPGIAAADWVEYNVETGDYDVDVAIEPPSFRMDGDPELFVYQVQGPKALDVLSGVTDADLEEIDFYRFEDVELAGRTVRVLGHGMSTEPGFEFHGPFGDSVAVRDAIMEAGGEHDIRRLGVRAYQTLSVKLGWLPPGVPPIYDVPEMEGYREWLDEDSREGSFSLDGSFDGDDITDYYYSPVELGYESLIDFDHDFVGREALTAEVADPQRTLVTLQWDDDDVVSIYGSLFEPGPTRKFMNLPRIGWARTNYDQVRRDGELVGISHTRSYQHDVRSIVSLCRMDVAFSEPGTEVTVVWGEGPGSPNRKAERHVQTEIAATVGPVPYSADRRAERADG